MRKTYTDQMGHAIQLSHAPRRIISLVPSQTELLFDLGLDEEVVGITRYCVHPHTYWSLKTHVGGTKKFNFDTIRKLAPDLIIGNKEENYAEGIRQLQSACPVWMSDIKTLQDAYDMIYAIGRLVGKTRQARALIDRIRKKMDSLDRFPTLRAAYFIWRNPFMVVGGETFIHDMMQKAGLANVFAGQPRYPHVTMEDIRAAQPQVILLSSEPYPFQEKDAREFRKSFADTQVKIVNGEMFSWYGSRLLKSADYLTELRQKLHD